MTTTEPTEQFGGIPAAAVIAACLRAQSAVPPRSRLARLMGRSPLSDESRSWYLGALGEIRVAEQLSRLDPDWTVLQSVPIGERGSDIDQVVMGAAGVFTINTKLHEDARVWVGSRRLLINGQKTDHPHNSRFEAQRVSQLLTRVAGMHIEVHPVLVLVGVRNITVREQPADVAVLRDTELVRWLQLRPAVLDANANGRLREAMAQRGAWSSTEAATDETHLSAFAALRREVNAAARTRALWVLSAMVGVT